MADAILLEDIGDGGERNNKEVESERFSAFSNDQSWRMFILTTLKVMQCPFCRAIKIRKQHFSEQSVTIAVICDTFVVIRFTDLLPSPPRRSWLCRFRIAGTGRRRAKVTQHQNRSI